MATEKKQCDFLTGRFISLPLNLVILSFICACNNSNGITLLTSEGRKNVRVIWLFRKIAIFHHFPKQTRPRNRRIKNPPYVGSILNSFKEHLFLRRSPKRLPKEVSAMMIKFPKPRALKRRVRKPALVITALQVRTCMRRLNECTVSLALMYCQSS